MPASSSEVSDDENDPTMETGSDGTAPEPASVHAGFTMEQVQTHFNAVMVEEQAALAPMSAFQKTQEKQRHNIFLLEQHRMAEGQIDGERTSEEVVAGEP